MASPHPTPLPLAGGPGCTKGMRGWGGKYHTLRPGVEECSGDNSPKCVPTTPPRCGDAKPNRSDSGGAW